MWERHLIWNESCGLKFGLCYGESLGLQGDPTSPSQRKSVIGRTDAEVESPILWPPDMKRP